MGTENGRYETFVNYVSRSLIFCSVDNHKHFWSTRLKSRGEKRRAWNMEHRHKQLMADGYKINFIVFGVWWYEKGKMPLVRFKLRWVRGWYPKICTKSVYHRKLLNLNMEVPLWTCVSSILSIKIVLKKNTWKLNIGSGPLV